MAGRALGQQARVEQVALARCAQRRAAIDVDVLIDRAAEPDHDVVARRRPRVTLLQRDVFLDDALGHGGDANGIGLHARFELQLEKRPGREREHHDGQHGRGEEREEELAVKAGAHLAQQRPSRRRCRASERRYRPRKGEQQNVGEADQGRQFRQVDQVIESRDDGEADHVNARAIVLDVGRVLPLAVAHRRPEGPS